MFNFLNIKSRDYNNNIKKVYVGMSGGVDSSVVAHMLKSLGYQVIGVFIKTWQPEYIECTWREDRLDAMRVAAQLDIPFVTLDLEKEYKEEVIDYMITEYEKGNTPNPDIMCNREVKFGAFYRYVKSIDLDAMIATGHYANIIGENNLSKAKDKTKDQVYFLAQIDKSILPYIMFPLGQKLKTEVRDYAYRHSIYVSDKKDSQGICMLGDISIKDFLKKETPEANELMFYTIGERFNFNINNSNNINLINLNNIKSHIINESKDNIEQGPFYIIKKDVKQNMI